MVLTDWISLTREAGNLLSQGRSTEAVSLYRQIAQTKPSMPEAHNNLGVALRSNGLLKEAIKSYQRAVKINPDYEIARKNMARALLEQDKIDESLYQFALIVQKNPKDEGIHSELIDVLSDISFAKPSLTAQRLFLFFFEQGSLDLQKLSASAVRLLICNNRFSVLLEAAEKFYSNRAQCKILIPKTLYDPLLEAVLIWTIIPSKKIEMWITMGRQQLLFALYKGKKIFAKDDLLWAIATQCQATELVFSNTRQEHEIVNALSKDLTILTLTEIAVVLMFLPLQSLSVPDGFWKKLVAQNNIPEAMKLLIQREVFDRIEETEIAQTIPKLTIVGDEVSKQVMGQYEEHPYPRWLTIDIEQKPSSLLERLKEQFPAFLPRGLNLDKPEILVAGCGTGRHAISTASRYSGSNVLAVDLSLRSLSYAARQALKLKRTNLNFAQADILNLGNLELRFDLIETSGVLHHMKNPSAGWESLRRLLKPFGIMRIGLYSSKGRSRWNSLREPIPQLARTESVSDFIRDRRTRILTIPDEENESVLTSIADFYSISGCRDLLYHESEIQFSILEIAEIMKSLNLTFLGFANLPRRVMDSFKNQWGSFEHYQDLEKWDIFEQENPDTFIAMYQFWCQANN